MTRKELNLAIFEGRARSVLWQPRLEEWIARNRENGTLPGRFRGLDRMAIYDELRCSVRYIEESVIEWYEVPDVERFEERPDENHRASVIRMNEGDLRTVHQEVWQEGKMVNSRILDFPVKTVEDLRRLIAFTNRRQFRVNPGLFKKAASEIGHRGEPTVFLSSSGFTELIKEWCGLAGTFYLLNDHRSVVEEYLEACDCRDDRLMGASFQLPCRIFNLGDHATNEFSPPPILKKYLLPRWQKIGERVRAGGCFVHTHWDGHSRLMLPYLKEMGLSGVEALTPLPMGDMTLEEIKDAVGDSMVVLDLIPAILFLPSYSTKDVLDFARRLMDMFAPRLIMGVSDEISAVGQIEKIEAVSELVDRTCGLAA